MYEEKYKVKETNINRGNNGNIDYSRIERPEYITVYAPWDSKIYDFDGSLVEQSSDGYFYIKVKENNKVTKTDDINIIDSSYNATKRDENMNIQRKGDITDVYFHQEKIKSKDSVIDSELDNLINGLSSFVGVNLTSLPLLGTSIPVINNYLYLSDSK